MHERRERFLPRGCERRLDSCGFLKLRWCVLHAAVAVTPDSKGRSNACSGGRGLTRCSCSTKTRFGFLALPQWTERLRLRRENVDGLLRIFAECFQRGFESVEEVQRSTHGSASSWRPLAAKAIPSAFEYVEFPGAAGARLFESVDSVCKIAPFHSSQSLLVIEFGSTLCETRHGR